MTKEELEQRKLELEKELLAIEDNISKLPKAPAWRLYKQGIMQVEAILKDNIWQVSETFEGIKVFKEFDEKDFLAYKERIKKLYFDLE